MRAGADLEARLINAKVRQAKLAKELVAQYGDRLGAETAEMLLRFAVRQLVGRTATEQQGANPDEAHLVARVLRVIVRRGGATGRDVRRVTNLPPDVVRKALCELVRDGKVVAVSCKLAGRGRPTVKYVPTSGLVS